MSSSSSSAPALPTIDFLGHKIPPMGLGLAALGRPGYININHGQHIPEKSPDTMKRQTAEVLSAAFHRGIRYFDAARSYGKAEEFLGAWLDATQPQGAVVGSKWGYYYTADFRVDTGGQPHEIKDHSASHLRKQTKETDHFLGPYLNLYQIHSATLESGVLDDPEVVRELFRLKEEKGWKIGLSLSGVKQSETLRRALSIQDPEGRRLFDSCQATWNLLEQSAGPALLEAHSLGLSVIIKEGMANGRLLSSDSSNLAKLEPKVQLLRSKAQQLGVQPDALALAAVLVQPFRPMVLSGAATVEHALSNFSALEVMGRADVREAVEELKGAMVQPAEEYWGDRSGLAWN